MGSFEKLVVLTVLFLVALVLGVTLNSGEPETDPSFGGPLDSARHRAGREQLDERSGTSGEGFLAPATPSAELGLLNTAVRRDPPNRATAAAPEPVVPGTLLVSTAGLSEHPLLPDFRIYRVQPDDTWAALSERFYGSRDRSARLRQANDDPAALVAGDDILVPVRDFGHEEVARPRAETWSDRASALPLPAQTAAKTAPKPTVVPESYTVAAGDSLSVISLKVYGTSRRWEEIFEANDALDDPHELQVGMVLRIP